MKGHGENGVGGADAILSAMPDIIRSMVKPLEWFEANRTKFETDQIRAVAANGAVHIVDTHFDTFYADVLPEVGVCGGLIRVQGQLPDEEAAKAAANEHRLSQIFKELGIS